MILSIILSRELSCGIGAIVRLVNGLQLFFVAEDTGARVMLPSKPVDDPYLSLSEVRSALESTGVLRASFPEQRYVLLTSRALEALSGSFLRRLVIISDWNRHWASPNQRSLWFAAQILKVGVVDLVDRRCANRGCICSVGSEYHFLCRRCEGRLRALDYGDALLHLREALQWLNERATSRSPRLSRSVTITIPARLRLAEYYAKRNRVSKPFRGKTVLMVLHFLSDLVPFVTALNEMGAAYSDMILIAKPYPYPKRDFISHHLEQLGVRVYRASDDCPVSKRARDVLRELSSQLGGLRERAFVVIEDGGYFTPLLHRKGNGLLLKRCIGSVEQTSKGIRRDMKIPRIRKPVLSVAKCAFKSRYEAPEIGRVTIQNITRFVPNVKLSGGHAIVFGFGDVGAQVSYYLNKSFNMGVSVVDKLPMRVMEARHRRDFVTEAEANFSRLLFRNEAVLVVGTTGETSISRKVLRQLPNGCIIVSTSSDKVEIDTKALQEMAGSRVRVVEEGKTVYSVGGAARRRVLTLLAGGYPINFYGSESLPNATIDPVMTLLLLCAIELCKGQVKEKKIDEAIVDALVKKHRLVERFLSVSRYRGS